MKSKKNLLIVATLLVCLLVGSYYTVSEATEFTKDKKKEFYNKIQNAFSQQKEDLNKLLKENPNDPTIGEKLKDLKDKASEVNTLAKEVDTDAYYRNKIKSFTAALEATIKDETLALEKKQMPMSLDPNKVEKLKKVVEEKKKLLEKCKKIDVENIENPKNVYDELKSEVMEITSQMQD